MMRWPLDGMIAPDGSFDSDAALGLGEALNAQHFDTMRIYI